MAESILFNLAENIITKLASSAFRELQLLWGADDELDQLQDTLSSIKAVLLDAEEQQSKSHAVKNWVSKLKEVLYEIDDFIDECSYERLRRQVMARDRRKRKQVRILFSKFKSNLVMGHKIKNIRERLKAINDDRAQFSFSERVIIIDTSHDELRVRRETHSFIPEDEVIGRNDDKKTVIDLLLNSNTNTNEENFAIISIVGMGGLGKTALAQSVYNDNKMTRHFELKLWVCISEEFDVKIIMEKMIESATGRKPESSLQMDSLQSELRRKLEGKKYLLVMDDVWNENHQKWDCLKRLLMGGAKGSKILITTRSEQVAKTFDTLSLYSLQKLDDCDSWLLFKKMTRLEGPEEALENSNLVQIGYEILAKLKGVPLAIRIIGRLLYVKKSQRFWSSFKDKELYRVMGQKNLQDMRSILELSYKYLPANLKQCFLYCALFPKDYEIQKDKLIRLWRAQGFIQPNDSDIGEDYFMELLSRSFFQEVTKDELGDIRACKMHDLMHDLACSITGNECVHGVENDINKRTCHFSLGSTSLDELKELPETLSKARNLRTFLMLEDSECDYWKLDFKKFFHNHLRFRTLHLELRDMDRNAQICKFMIDKLKHLRYLSIPNLHIEDFPNYITELYNLETLIIPGWRNLKNLPSDIKKLINLKHLDLRGNLNLEILPDSITELCKLEALILNRCGKLKELPRDVKNWIKLRFLDLSFNYGIEFLPDSLTQLNNLETLRLTGCSTLKELPRDTKKLFNLKHLDVHCCENLTHMPKGLGELTNLQEMCEFVVGKDNHGVGLSELNGLNQLRGTLCIRNLQFCSAVDLQMKEANKLLQRKSGLQMLVLQWNNNSCDDSRMGDLDDNYEIVLDCLQPHSNLQHIWIWGYKGVKLCNWVSSNSIGGLVTIVLMGCKRLQHLPQLDKFPHLKHLTLEDLPSIEYIIGNEDDFVCSSTLFFPSLEELSIVNMPKLKRWGKPSTISTESTESSEGSFPIIFPCLLKLEIYGSPLHTMMSWHAPLLTSLQIGYSALVNPIQAELEFDVVSLIDFEDEHPYEFDVVSLIDLEDEHPYEFDVVPWTNFENLSTLRFSCLSKLEYLPKCLQHVTTLQSLCLYCCDNLRSLPEWIDNLTSLKRLEIIDCKSLTSLPEGIHHIHGLQSLRISRCPILAERCKKDTGEDWPKIAHIPDLSVSYW